MSRFIVGLDISLRGVALAALPSSPSEAAIIASIPCMTPPKRDRDRLLRLAEVAWATRRLLSPVDCIVVYVERPAGHRVDVMATVFGCVVAAVSLTTAAPIGALQASTIRSRLGLEQSGWKLVPVGTSDTDRRDAYKTHLMGAAARWVEEQPTPPVRLDGSPFPPGETLSHDESDALHVARAGALDHR